MVWGCRVTLLGLVHELILLPEVPEKLRFVARTSIRVTDRGAFERKKLEVASIIHSSLRAVAQGRASPCKKTIAWVRLTDILQTNLVIQNCSESLRAFEAMGSLHENEKASTDCSISNLNASARTRGIHVQNFWSVLCFGALCHR